MLRLSLISPPDIRLMLEPAAGIRLDFAGVTVASGETYSGPAEATPSLSEQVFRTQGLVMAEDFTVHPIPQNYGLITYNGFGLTVS